jgi:uncharacterized protein YihD (DUF1040 family)
MATRDPARIDEILEYLRRCWIHQPDTRLTQLLVNVANTGEAMPRFYNVEDHQIERALKEESQRLSKAYLAKE